MNILIILATALLPVAFLLYYIYKSDPLPEPSKFLWKSFLYGVLIIIPVSFVEMPINLLLINILPENSMILSTAKAFFVAAIPEESFKLLALWLVLRKNPYFDEHIDGIIYAVFVSLGFAAFENIGYLFTNMDEWMKVGFMRALLALPGHYAFGVLMGFFYSLYYFVNRSRRNKILILAAPIMAHGIYDTCCFMGEVSEIYGIIGFVCVVIFCIWMHRFCHHRILTHKHRDNKYFGNLA